MLFGFLSGSGLITCSLALRALAVEPCANMAYEDINQAYYGPLLSRLVGYAVDPSGVAVPGVCVGLFTESEHRLVIATATLANGEFTLKTPPKGDYRLVGQLPHFGVLGAR